MTSFAQVTKIRGRVLDSKTKQPLPFVNIAFKGTTIGTTSDFDGNYFLETRKPSDTLFVSFVGYKEQNFFVKKGQFQTINVDLVSETIDLQEVVVVPGENPAHVLLRKIIANKHKNNPARFDSYQAKTYTKMEMDLNNVNEDFKKKKIMRKFQFVFNYMDTSAITGKAYLPVFITESLSDYYYQKKPRVEREIIQASQISGIKDNSSLAQFTGKLHQNINIYDNFIKLFDFSFASPISDGGLNYYKYYLTDSTFRDGVWSYSVSFKPKRKQEHTFVGHFWVADSSYAIQEMQMRIAKGTNLNWVKDLVSKNEFQQLNDSTWFIKKQNLFVDFMLTGKDSTKQMGFFGRKTVSYDDVKVNVPIKDEIVKLDNNVIVKEDALLKPKEYWDNYRPYKLSSRESGIYSMVDSIQHVPLYKNIVDIISTLFTGYYTKGDFEYGPYHRVFSFNKIEGNRFMFGGRTSENFSKKIRLNGYLAYGTKDKKFKYNVGFLYMINKLPRQTFGIQYTHDMTLLGKNNRGMDESSILRSILKRKSNDKLILINKFIMHYEKEWFQGLSNKIELKHLNMTPSKYVPFVIKNNNLNETKKSITTAEVKLNTRWTKNEKNIIGTFDRRSFGGPFPIFNLDLTLGMDNTLRSDYKYFKVDLSIEQKLQIPPLGTMRYQIAGGKLYGKVPFPLLHLHAGNETYAFNRWGYNMMNYYEFASDQYVSLSAEHHFNGLILDRIPLLRKLKWRTVLSGKALWGSLKDKNNGSLSTINDQMIFPDSMSELGKPYFEAGVGVENIFKFFRIDAMWRLSHLKEKGDQKIQKFGIRASVQLKF